MTAPTPPEPPPSRSPDAADLALAKVAVPWVGRHHIGDPKAAPDLVNIRSPTAELAHALAVWLQARGIY